MITAIIIKIIIFFVLMGFHAFFNGAETAVTSLSVSYLRRYKETGGKKTRAVIYWETHTDEIMTTMVIGMNLSIVGMGVTASSLATGISEAYAIRNGVVIVLLPVTAIFLALVFGNIFPKTFARYNAERIGIAVLPSIIMFSKFFKQIVGFLSGVSNKIIKIFSKKKETQSVKADEIDFLLSNETTSPLSEEGRELVSNIMDFSEKRASQVMVPRQEIFAVNIEDKKEDIINKIIETKFSRVPVYKGTLNHIIGIIYSKDLAIAWRNSDIIVVEDLIRPAHYVPDSARVDKVLKEFKTGHHHVSIVVDEFGSTVGILSIEDLLEEIVGEVWDEYDMKEKTIVPYGDNSYLVQTQESVLNLNKELNINIPEDEDYSTVNGWILKLFDKIPDAGEKIKWQNFEIEIQDADDKKVNRIILRQVGSRKE
ncbi:MAG: hemolysin family protein [Endomicrobia bacterium]|nr:hemolysin family protein [Endomicrobiia bacterium]MCL2798995.1 hemolysin family protein [Endomicrobiia bacterium]